MTDDFDPLFDEFLDRHLRRRARLLALRLRLATGDAADYYQDLALDVVAGRPAYDPGLAAWNTFAFTLTARTISGIDRASRAAKRGRGRTRSLEALGSRDGPVDLPARDEVAAFERALDVAAVLSTLPPDLVDLALRLQRDSAATVARDLGIARTSAYRRMAKLRQAFERGGFGEPASARDAGDCPEESPRKRRQ